MEAGTYRTLDGTITIENRNAGKRDACWVAFSKDNPRIAWDTTLAAVRRKLKPIMTRTP